MKESSQRYRDWISLAGRRRRRGRGCVSHTTLSVKRKESAASPPCLCDRRRAGDEARGHRWGRQNDWTAESLTRVSSPIHPDRAAPSTPPPTTTTTHPLPPHSSPPAAGAPPLMLTCSPNKKHPKLNKSIGRAGGRSN